MSDKVQIRTHLKPSDIVAIVRYHDFYYAENYGFNHDFGKYVEGPLTEFYNRKSIDERIWLLEDENGLKGCIALAKVSDEEAQLRWFFVDESLRGQGYGQKLITLLMDFAAEMNYKKIFLWTVSQLAEARRVYERNGFVLEEEKGSEVWGVRLVEQRFARRL
jgi:GNAT superfamily N-acetyltransferase